MDWERERGGRAEAREEVPSEEQHGGGGCEEQECHITRNGDCGSASWGGEGLQIYSSWGAETCCCRDLGGAILAGQLASPVGTWSEPAGGK